LGTRGFILNHNTIQEEMYLDLLHYVLTTGEERSQERTGTGTCSVFNATLDFDLGEGFPLLTTKRVPFNSVLSELLWFLEGSTDERRLAEIHFGDSRENLIDKTTIWTANANKQGVDLGYTNTDTVKELGPVYGKQWRDFNGVDQIQVLIDSLKNNPQSRRHILSAWNVGEIDRMALPPCHMFAQFYVSNDKKLSCTLYQRSADMFLGVPFNIASYALLTHMLAQVTDLDVGTFNHLIGDAHIYSNHIDAIQLQLNRTPYDFPTLKMNTEISDINDFSMKDFEVLDYKHHGTIKAPMAV
jgi:thymidylate synthase|tara:strand:- start:2018 stop:2914 length:897 start_codon:yes stop_codon:yes gene_type:complete